MSAPSDGSTEDTFATFPPSHSNTGFLASLKRSLSGRWDRRRISLQEVTRFGRADRMPAADRDALVGSERGAPRGSQGYEEFHQDTVPCPSCKGLGRIPKADEAKLVALIPYSDKRLKPRRTTLYVSLAVVVSLALSSLLIFFLIPRQISLYSSEPRINPYYTTVNTSRRRVELRFKNVFNVSNENYFDVTLRNITMTAIHDKETVKSERVPGMSPYIRLRDRGQISVPMNVTFDGGYVAQQCDMWFSEILIHFRVSCIASYLLHTEEVSLDTYQMVNCTHTN